jgi:hypothetical protein
LDRIAVKLYLELVDHCGTIIVMYSGLITGMQQRMLLSAHNHMAPRRPKLLPANDEDKKNHLPRDKRKSHKATNCQDDLLTPTNFGKASGTCQKKATIRRPPNAFFIFANEKRK